jgi:hypothetical protein
MSERLSSAVLCYASLLIFVEMSLLQQLRKTYFIIFSTTYFSIYSSVLLRGIYQCHEMQLTLLNSFLAEANCLKYKKHSTDNR